MQIDVDQVVAIARDAVMVVITVPAKTDPAEAFRIRNRLLAARETFRLGIPFLVVPQGMHVCGMDEPALNALGWYRKASPESESTPAP